MQGTMPTDPETLKSTARGMEWQAKKFTEFARMFPNVSAEQLRLANEIADLENEIREKKRKLQEAIANPLGVRY